MSIASRTPIIHTAAIVTIAIGCLIAPANAADFYIIDDLGTLSGDASRAVGINAAGVVVGSAEVAPYNWEHAFVTTPLISDAGTPGSYLQSHLEAINNNGQAVGWVNSDGEDIEASAYLWQAGSWIELGALPGHDFSRAMDINDRGQVVGRSYVRWSPPYPRAWIWQDGEMTALATPEYSSGAYAINASGTHIAGWVNEPGTTGRNLGAVWVDGEVTELALASGDTISSAAYDVNDRGVVVGATYSFFYFLQSATPFLWDGSTLMALAKPAGWNIAFARAINNANQVVGDLQGSGDPGLDGFIWEDGTTRRLSQLIDPDGGWLIVGAQDINDAGQIAATGRSPLGETHAVRLVPIPTGDLNCDGALDFADIDPFVLALAGQSAYEAAYPSCRWLGADANGDGSVDYDDVDAFVALLGG